MPKMLLIIITGAPGTGKTSLGRHLAAALGMPFIHKDGIKETLFDSLGWKDRAWSKKLGAAAMDLLFYFVEVQLGASRSFIVESNFYPEFDTPRFAALQKRYSFAPFQILCKTDPRVLAQRYQRRTTSGERHPGHVDHVLCEEFDPVVIQRRHGALGIGGRVLAVDTTDFKVIDYDSLVQAVTLAASDEGMDDATWSTGCGPAA
jgi:predicted kinase